MITLSKTRSLTLLAAFLTAATLPAHASDPVATSAAERALLREANGYYALEDGRTLRVYVGQRRLSVGVDQFPLESWRAETVDLLVSPDGHRRLRLHRNVDGTVDRVDLEIDQPR